MASDADVASDPDVAMDPDMALTGPYCLLSLASLNLSVLCIFKAPSLRGKTRKMHKCTYDEV